MQKEVTIALPKGKLGDEALELLGKAGLPVEDVQTESRQLLFQFPREQIRYIICRPTDIPIYVDYGAADLGIVGKDTVVEAGAEVFELVDLKFGRCRFVAAVPKQAAEEYLNSGQGFSYFDRVRVATKFPRVAREYFASKGMQVEVVKLHGNIELAPRVGLAEMIVDIVSTGRTLAENDLVPVADIFEATARLIANRVSYRIHHHRMQTIVEHLRLAVGNGGERQC
ncbi:MAG: ATP phosphoribosyltransferase [Bacillota bacterium]